MVGGRHVLADFTVECHVEDSAGIVGQDVGLRVVLEGFGAPDFSSLGLWVLHLLCEGFGEVAVHECACFLSCEVGLSLRGQGCDILLDIFAELCFIEVAHEDEVEVGCVAIELACQFYHFVVVEVLYLLGGGHPVKGVVAIDSTCHGVLEHHAAVEADVLELGDEQIAQVVERVLVFVEVGEAEINELHQCLKVFRGGVSLEGVLRHLDVVGSAHLLAGEGFLQVGGHEVAKGALCEEDVGELQGHGILFRED